MRLADTIRSIWTAHGFAGRDVADYAQDVLFGETRQGVRMLSLFSLLLMLGATALHARLGLSDPHVYTFLALAALSLHILLSTGATRRLRELYMLAITLLVISGTALVLLAQQDQQLRRAAVLRRGAAADDRADGALGSARGARRDVADLPDVHRLDA